MSDEKEIPLPLTHNLVITWSCYEHEHIEREPDWFWALGIAAGAAAITSVIFGNILFAFVLLLSAIIIGLLARIPPEKHTFELSEKGLKIGDKLHRFKEMTAFWVEDEVHIEHPFLLIRIKKLVTPQYIIKLEGVDPRLVRAFMREHVEEVEMREPLSHHLLAYFGF